MIQKRPLDCRSDFLQKPNATEFETSLLDRDPTSAHLALLLPIYIGGGELTVFSSGVLWSNRVPVDSKVASRLFFSTTVPVLGMGHFSTLHLAPPILLSSILPSLSIAFLNLPPNKWVVNSNTPFPPGLVECVMGLFTK
uniref:Cytochrome c oxidase subunit 1 n=1 Tax=Ascaris lumbricoides TaxID=6252 RepID=A0A0M3HMM3_ASCLU